MSEYDSTRASGDVFEASAAAETAVAAPAFEGSNVSRVASLSTMLGGDGVAIRSLTPELDTLGFSSQLSTGERLWRDRTPAQSLPDFREARGDQETFDRVRLWLALNESGRPQEAIAFLVAVLGSELERESAAAAAALWRELGTAGSLVPGGPRRWHLWDRLFDLWDEDLPGWPWLGPVWPPDLDAGAAGGRLEDLPSIPWDPVQWRAIFQRVTARFGDPYTDLFLITVLTRWRLGRALRSPDRITQSLAMAAFEPTEPTGTPAQPQPPAPATTPPGALVVSTMIHGTWGWKGDWWRPRSDFHEFVLRNLRPNLYSRGAKFSWSGAYSDKQRDLAARDLAEWARDVAPNGMQTVFAHSHGAEVAARAIIAGARIHELVLLSAPVTTHIDACAGTSLRLVDIRLRMDPVLALARARQRIPARPNLTTVLLNRWRLGHGATHEEVVWRDEDIAARGGL